MHADTVTIGRDQFDSGQPPLHTGGVRAKRPAARRLLTPDEFRRWAVEYYDRYGFKCVPTTGKTEIYLSEEAKWHGNILTVPDDAAQLSTGIFKGEGWLDAACEAAERYRAVLTGIACVCWASDVLGVDFDNAEFFKHWERTYRIDCPVTKSRKGYHAFFRSRQRLRRTLITDYYDVQGWMLMVLPPSYYYSKTNCEAGYDRKQWVFWGGDVERYRWVRESALPELDLAEIGLVPRWFLEEGEAKVYSTRKLSEIKYV